MNTQSYNISYQEELIGSMLLNNDLVKELYLQPKHFIENRYITIVSKMLNMYAQNKVVDPGALVNEFQGDELTQNIILDSMENVTVVSNFYFYQEKLEQQYKVVLMEENLQKYKERNIDYPTLMENLKKIESEFIKNDDSTATMLSPNETFELVTTEANLLEFQTFHFMEEKLRLLKNTINVIAARTSQGKSAFALNLMNDLSKKYKCLYFNMEMTEKEIYQRLVAINCGIPIDSFYNFKKDSKISDGIWKGIEEIHHRKIKIYQGSKSVKALRTILMKESRQEHCVAFIDYIGYVSSNKAYQNDRERIGEVVRDLQTMTKDLNITIFLIAQINREGNDTPTLVNLKDSGELEQTAHCVMMIHNPNKDDLAEQSPIVQILIPKNRNGKLGHIYMQFDKPTQTFRFTNNTNTPK